MGKAGLCRGQDMRCYRVFSRPRAFRPGLTVLTVIAIREMDHIGDGATHDRIELPTCAKVVEGALAVVEADSELSLTDHTVELVVASAVSENRRDRPASIRREHRCSRHIGARSCLRQLDFAHGDDPAFVLLVSRCVLQQQLAAPFVLSR